jgi:hypothetical protein
MSSPLGPGHFDSNDPYAYAPRHVRERVKAQRSFRNEQDGPTGAPTASRSRSMTPEDARARRDKQSKAAPFDLGAEAAENFANKLVSLREHSLQKPTSLSGNGAGREHSMNWLPDVTRELLPNQPPMVPERAIALAVAGGWKRKSSQFSADIALSLTFWTSLGKSLAWKGAECFRNARRFHSLVEQSGDTQIFWQELLSTNINNPLRTSQ